MKLYHFYLCRWQLRLCACSRSLTFLQPPPTAGLAQVDGKLWPGPGQTITLCNGLVSLQQWQQSHTAGHILRDFTLGCRSTPDGTERTTGIKQFTFKAWPRDGVPLGTRWGLPGALGLLAGASQLILTHGGWVKPGLRSVIELIDLVEQTVAAVDGPIMVLCRQATSASATYVACSIALTQLRVREALRRAAR